MNEMESMLAPLSFWEHLTKDQQTETLFNARIQHYDDRELIYSPARGCLGLLLVKKGILRTYFSAEDGRRATVFRIREKEVCVLSMSCLLEDITFDVEIQAEGACDVVILPASYLSRLSADNIYVESFSYKIVTERFSDIMHAVSQLLFFSLRQRVIAFLLDESTKTESEVLKMTQEQLAENIGSAREAVSRILKTLAKEKLIAVNRGEIQLLDKKSLYPMIELQ